jgi:Beta-galactosidase/beta-glucuronidase
MKSTKLVTAAISALLLSASAFAVGVEQVAIDKDWTFKQVRGNSWYPATVPGVVHTDLMDNGIIEDPHFRLNERGVQWVDKEDWEYKTQFNVSAETFSKSNIILDFKGLDTYADVYLNDSCILKANNMFREWQVDVKGLVKQGENELRVYLHSPIKVDIPKFDAIHYPIEAGNDQSENGGIFDKKLSVFARKAGYHYGWDWGPRLVTSGIWRPIYVVAWNDARIENVHYIQESVTARRANVKVRTEVIADNAGEAVLEISYDGLRRPISKKVNLTKGLNVIEQDVVVNNPKLWWSNGLGEAHLYTFTTSVKLDGNTADSQCTDIGLRSIRVVRDKDEAGHTFYFELNGVPVFSKGANYIPQDNFLPRVTAERYEQTILDAVNANMNMLRIWGGGIYEEKIFYDLCDKYGILVWQDFMFACSTYPMNPEMLDNIKHEAIDNIRRIRNHASIAIWCGNNENHTAWFNWGWERKYKALGVYEELRKDYKDLFHGVLEDAVADHDATRFYWPSSPYGGEPDERAESGRPNWNPNGDAHYWGVWHAKDSIANFNIIRARYFSEYGFQSFPEYQSVLKYAPEEKDHDIFSEVMMAHQRGGSHANGLIEWYLLNEYRQPKDFQNFLYMGLLLQGDAIKTAIEAHRRDMPYCMGTLYWQHNDCWPVASWSSRDYYGRWKAQHYFTRKAFENVLVSPIKEDDKLNVYIVSDNLSTERGKLEVRVMDLAGNVLFENNKNVTVSANASKIYFSQDINSVLAGKNENEVVVHARFISNKGNATTANYFLTRYKDIDFPKANITKKVVAAAGGYDVTLTSNNFARGVFLSIEGIDNFFSDNYFDLLPNESRTIHVRTDKNQATFEKELTAISISDAY